MRQMIYKIGSVKRVTLNTILVLTTLHFSYSQCTKYEPIDGKIMLVIGQDFNATGRSIYGSGYCDDPVLGVNPPAGITTYCGTGLSPGAGITNMIDYGAGPLHANLYTTTPYYSNSVIMMGLYMVNDLGNILAGNKNTELDALANWIKSVNPRPVYLRIGYEFEYQYGCCPTQYIQAWQYIVNRFRTFHNVTNVAYVWQAASGAGSDAYLLQWYPGDAYVDWFGYSHFYTNSDVQSNGFLNLARSHRKPVMIAEATPYGYNLASGISATTAWNNYFVPMFNHINNNLDVIKALCYINQNWDAQPLWNGQGWGNSKIQDNSTIKANWNAEVTKSHWLHGVTTLFSSLQNNSIQQPYGGVVHSIPGTIEAEDFDSGCSGLSYFDNTSMNSGSSNYRFGSSVDIGTTSDVSGGQDVGWISSGEWLEYTVNIAATGSYTFNFRVSTPINGNFFRIEQDGLDVSGSIAVPNTGSWSSYSTLVKTNVNLTSGSHVVRIYFENVLGFNLNYFTVSSPLPLNVLSFSLGNKNNIVLIHGSINEDASTSYYEIQRAYENTTKFDSIGVIQAIDLESDTHYFLFQDTLLKAGSYYYRLKQVEQNGEVFYTSIQFINVENTVNIIVKPNPFDQSFLIISNQEKLFSISIMDLTGRVVYQDDSYKTNSTIDERFDAGLYIVRIACDGLFYHEKIVKQ